MTPNDNPGLSQPVREKLEIFGLVVYVYGGGWYNGHQWGSPIRRRSRAGGGSRVGRRNGATLLRKVPLALRKIAEQDILIGDHTNQALDEVGVDNLDVVCVDMYLSMSAAFEQL
ncbi:hypothetical protein PSTG_13720 [Puccinia striiformis f. sp. tritici PST-78]|uniref:Uncharacterized protein n=1 Tax=Puccinia striiformis f. sp. tritici PST-78 TaxID=1165861 RepID=A0A0L0V102_9BASI|nr:hypothetical protein PSTG_13720 [Puccinia striiformis f. sp. tritici PST-78]